MHVVIVGGGIAGLVAARELARAGAEVTLVERDRRLGGLAGSFEIEPGVAIERYYHFICRPDDVLLHALAELGLGDRVRWVTTSMGLYRQGTLRTFGDPLSLLAYPGLSVAGKLRFASATVKAKLRSGGGWADLEDRTARDWLVGEYGEEGYDLLFRSLLEKKFREFGPRVSAAWMWARLNRVGNSRTITQRERIGYIVGGSQAYVDALESAARASGARLLTGVRALELVRGDGGVREVRTDAGALPADSVLVTVPIPHAVDLFAGFDGAYFDNLRSLDYIHVLAMVLRLDRRFTKYFWTNVSDPRIDLPGLIEYTNLNPCRELGGDAVMYLPQYLSSSHPFWTASDEALSTTFCGYLKLIRPEFSQEWIRRSWVFRTRFAQPICETGFSRRIPSIQTPVPNLYLTDSYQLHPHDRTISNSTHLGREASRRILAAARP